MATIGYFNAENEAPMAVADACLAAIEVLAHLQPSGYLSVKAPALAYDPTQLDRIAAAARRRDLLLHFDSHQPETAQATLQAIERLGSQQLRLGMTIPARWQRSLADVDWAIEHGMRVRVVKGQWGCPVLQERDPRTGFLELVDRLAGHAGEVAVATHDTELARAALHQLLRSGTPCELELLPGLPSRGVLGVAEELNVPVRLYVPFGQAWLPYAQGHIVRDPRLLWRALCDSANGLTLIRP